MSDYSHGTFSKVPRSGKSSLDRDPYSTRQADTKLKSYFKDALEERRQTQESVQETHGRLTRPETSLYSGLSISKSDAYDLKHDDEKDVDSNNTSALLEENLDDEEDDYNEVKEKPKKKYSWDDDDDIKEDRISKVEPKSDKKTKYIQESRQTENSDLSLEDSYHYGKDKLQSNKKSDKFGSDKKFYDSIQTESVMSDKFNSDVKRKPQTEDYNLQVSKKAVDFGVLYPTEQKEDTVELFNRGNEDLRIELKVTSQRSGAKFYIAGDDGSLKLDTSLVINKYSFKKVKLSVETGSFGVENERDRDFNGTVIIKIGGSHDVTEIALNCRLENPSLQILDSSVEKMVGNVPFININLSSLGIGDEIQIPFRNNGKRPLLIEFELVSNAKLAEIIFSPKYLSLKEGEEKTLGIKPIRSFDYENKRKAILKYRIKGTRLCQCIVVNLL